MISSCQQYNNKLRELRIFDSTLTFTDFHWLRQIITLVPRLDTLTMEDCVIPADKEFKCIE